MNNKVVIITGGSSGIGRALAFEFGNHKARIVITGRRKEAIDQAGEDLKAAGIDCLAIQSDVTIEDDSKRMVDQTIEKFGKIDILINNAGVSMRASFEEVKIDVIRKVMDINFYGTVNVTKLCLPHIIHADARPGNMYVPGITLDRQNGLEHSDVRLPYPHFS